MREQNQNKKNIVPCPIFTSTVFGFALRGETPTLTRALLAIIGDPDVWFDGRKRVVANLRLPVSHSVEKSALPRRRLANTTYD